MILISLYFPFKFFLSKSVSRVLSFKMYQENLDEEIRDLQNISSEEASEEIIFNV